jgi:DNA invertase Pin-like site-specific DNA recombinase
MKIGYARTSTIEQQAGFDAQLRDLEALGCERVFSEQLSSVADRPQLVAMLANCRDGDTIHVTRLDRLARSVSDMLAIVERVRAKGTAIVLPGIGTISGDDPMTTLLVNVLSAIAQFEREIMLARQREGIARAKAAGKYRGRTPTARRKADEVRKLIAEGVAKVEIARRLGMHRASVHRILQHGAAP